MRSYSIGLIALAFLLFSCEPVEVMEPRETACSGFLSEYPVDRGEERICTDDICSKYLAIWMDLIKEKNDLSQEFVDSHIELHRTSLNSWKDGISFRVCYNIQIDWAVTYSCDKFIIKIDPANSQYPAIPLPRNTELTKEQVEIAIEKGAFSSSLANISNATQILYPSFDDALSDLIEYSPVNTLCFTKISLDKKEGNLLFEAKAEYINEENSCIYGTANLTTGEMDTYDSLCYF